MTSTELLLIIAVLPSVLLGTFIYKHDKLEKEPSKLLVKLFAGGALSVVITLLVTIMLSFFIPSILDSEQKSIMATFIDCFVFVALIEEGSKWLILKVITFNNKNFDHLYDAIIYAAFVSLGFATLENILYVFENGFLTGILRALVSVPGHLFFSIFMGYFYGIAKHANANGNQALYKRNMFLSLLVPIILHGFFDFCLSCESIFLIIVFFIFVIGLYIKCFQLVKRISKEDKPFIKNYYCPYCGNHEEGKYCSNCGNKLV